MMKKQWLYSFLALSLVFGACTKESYIEDQIEETDGRYMTLSLDVDATKDDTEEMRALFYAENNSTYFVFGTAGQTLYIPTVIYNGSQIIYTNERLPWVVSSNGRRLVCKQKVRIKPELLANPNLSIVAKLDEQAKTGDAVTVLQATVSGEERKMRSINFPSVMTTKLKQEGSVLRMSEASTARFKPQGTLVRVILKNNMKIPTFATGISVTLANGETLSRPFDTGSIYPQTNDSFQSLLPVGAQAENSDQRALLWLPYVNGEQIVSLKTFGPAAGVGVPSKTITKAGQQVAYTITINPGSPADAPFGLLTNSDGILQYYVDMEDGKAFFNNTNSDTYVKKFRENSGYPLVYTLSRYMLTPFSFLYRRSNITEDLYAHSFDGDIPETTYIGDGGAILDLDKVNTTSFGFSRYSVREKKVGNVIYSDMFTTTPDVRLSRRYTMISKPSLNSHEPSEILVEFLPYDSNEPDAAFDPQYWAKNQSKIKKVRIPMVKRFGNSLVNTHLQTVGEVKSPYFSQNGATGLYQLWQNGKLQNYPNTLGGSDMSSIMIATRKTLF